IAIDNHYDVVICGHIHKPVIRSVETEKGKVLYLNSGDWIENLSWLEYHEKKWNLLLYHEAVESGLIPTKQESEYEISKTPEVEITDKWQESQNGMTNMKLDKFPPLSNVLFTDINEQVLSD
ncbi:MAG: hypothetical protein LAT67_11810, partial [Balneolales bacterium]|nr:hypothetical protein [Balneolales bacterium]